MKNKTFMYIGIVLLTVAVAAFLFFKKKNSGTSTASDAGSADGNSSKFLDLNDTDSIIDSMSISKDLKKTARSWVKEINKQVKNNAGGWSRSGIESKASDNGITYSQQIVLSAFWQMYATAQAISMDQYKSFEAELEEM